MTKHAVPWNVSNVLPDFTVSNPTIVMAVITTNLLPAEFTFYLKVEAILYSETSLNFYSTVGYVVMNTGLFTVTR
jgi:hypothetical protein